MREKPRNQSKKLLNERRNFGEEPAARRTVDHSVDGVQVNESERESKRESKRVYSLTCIHFWCSWKFHDGALSNG